MRSLLTYNIAALSMMVCSLCANASWWDDLKQLSKEAIKHTSERAENAIAKGIAVEQPAQALPTDADANYAYFNEPVFLSKLVYKELGTQHANKLILVHGLGELAMQDWDSVYSDLALQYHVVALDLPGFGLSAKPYGRYSPSNYARVINALAYHLGFEQFTLIGHSMGGAVSLKYAELYPERLNKLVLVSAAGILDKTAFVKQFVDFSKFISTDKYTDRVVKQGAQVNLSFLESIMLKGPQPEPSCCAN
jgi:pimeloyl-ACP methyl ester carboxylesterase